MFVFQWCVRCTSASCCFDSCVAFATEYHMCVYIYIWHCAWVRVVIRWRRGPISPSSRHRETTPFRKRTFLVPFYTRVLALADVCFRRVKENEKKTAHFCVLGPRITAPPVRRTTNLTNLYVSDRKKQSVKTLRYPFRLSLAQQTETYIRHTAIRRFKSRVLVLPVPAHE